MEKENIKNEELQENVNQSSEKIKELVEEVHKVIVWQDSLIKNLIIWLLTKWHILLEWVPWLAKTLTIDTLSQTLDVWFNRVQFTPDLLPSDLIWTEIYNQKTWDFTIKKWPIFNNFILADEINRAPSKVQSALLEAMAEKHITIWNNTFQLDEPFIVLATQNPVDQSWTYKLPEAQLDRFLLKTIVDYPSKEEEVEMYEKLNENKTEKLNKILDKKWILELQKIVWEVHVSKNIFNYVSDIIDFSRFPEKYWFEDLKTYIAYWISPRWWLALISASKVVALMNWRTFVIPEDIKEIAFDALNHRVILSYEAIANNVSTLDIVKKILDNVKVS